jgi:tryptophan-rich sensory protein
MRPAFALVLFVGICLLAGAAGGALTASAVRDWYPTLAKPSWTPPSWVFGPAWTTLYILMGVAAFLVWRRTDADRAARRLALGLFGVQLVLNIAWSGVFFGLRQPGWAVAEIAMLWVAIVATIWAFARVSRPAALLLLPYITWTTFAAALNTAIWRMNA